MAARALAPTRTYATATWVFLRVLGVVYLIAFWSLGTQVLGLVGERGILPASAYMAAARTWAASEHVGLDRYHLLPTLCWISTSDSFLRALCAAGTALSALLVAGVAPLVALPLLWLDYLSLAVVCRDFLGYQWDALLLETGFLAIGLAPAIWLDRRSMRTDPPRIAVWLMLWLLFRLMLGSGLVKLASGDPTWRGLSALTFHYETQPLPTPLAFYAHQLPVWIQRASTLLTLLIEIGVPFLMFGSRRLRVAACVSFALLQALIAATGNYAFFNVLAVALCLFLLDDDTLGPAKAGHYPKWRSAVSPVVSGFSHSSSRHRGVLQPDLSDSGNDVERDHWMQRGLAKRVHRVILIVVAAIIVPVSAYRFAASIGVPVPGGQLFELAAIVIEPFRSVNSYGLFAVMTTTRPEIIVEGSDDGERWMTYEFKYKAGDVRRRPPIVAPHQPRLDWQMWFAALESYREAAWFRSFCTRLLEGSPDVRHLLASDPFNGRPPRYIRAVLYRYHFADSTTHRKEAVWWTREVIGDYSPVLTRNSSGR
jgi:lipase maturation factor 1